MLGLNAAVDLPITGGEQYTTLEQFRPYLEKSLRDQHGVEALAVYVYPAQVVFCKKPLQGLADLVDRKMREVAEHVNTADTARIAILAALNLADELFRIQSQQEGERVEIREKVAKLTEELSEALDG